MKAPNEHVLEVVTGCPSCRDGAQTQQSVYVYAFVYLCEKCRELWADADRRAHRSGGCPHRPKPCVMDRASCVAADTAAT